MPRVEVAIELDTITCFQGTCAMTFAVPLNWRDQKIRDHSDFYCPNGHAQHFLKKSREEELKEELARTKATISYYRTRNTSLEERQTTLQRRVAAQKGVATRLRNKAIAGECAFCHERFANVADHVQAEHPSEASEPEGESDG